MRSSLLLLIVALQMTACGGSSPTAPAPPPVVVVPPVVVPPVLQMISVSPCPTSTPGVEFGFYLEIGCNSFDGPIQPDRKWNVAPKVYLKTVDEAGAAIDAVTLDTVQNAMVEAAPHLTAGKFQIVVERGTGSREGQSGWVTVRWPATPLSACGISDVARDGGTIDLSYKTAGCDCSGSAIRPRTARHELGHALGYWHSDSTSDLMSNLGITKPCDQGLSARELQAVAYKYR